MSNSKDKAKGRPAEIRGLRSLKTLGARIDQRALPYRSYMQITCLEMERARREMERRSASSRVAAIDARIAEIDAEKAALLIALGERAGGNAPAETGARVTPAETANSADRRKGRAATAGFKLKY